MDILSMLTGQKDMAQTEHYTQFNTVAVELLRKMVLSFPTYQLFASTLEEFEQLIHSNMVVPADMFLNDTFNSRQYIRNCNDEFILQILPTLQISQYYPIHHAWTDAAFKTDVWMALNSMLDKVEAIEGFKNMPNMNEMVDKVKDIANQFQQKLAKSEIQNVVSGDNNPQTQQVLGKMILDLVQDNVKDMLPSQ